MNEDQMKMVLRRLDSIEKIANLTYKDREILEDISIRLGKVEDEVKYLKERVGKQDKNLTSAIAEVQEKAEEIKDTVDQLVP